MTRHLLLLVSLAGVCAAQSTVTVRGKIEGAPGPANLYVELYDSLEHRIVDRAVASSDGSVEFHGVSPTMYELRVVTQFGEVLATADADARQIAAPAVIALGKPRRNVRRDDPSRSPHCGTNRRKPL
jgi:hypothetical protein